MRTGKSFRISTSLGVLTMKIRVKPALRSRLLAAGVSLTSFAAMVLGFMQESQFTPPELSVKQVDAEVLVPQETISTKTPLPTGETVLLPSPTSSQRPSAQPTKSQYPIAVNPSPASSKKPSAQPTKSATPSASPTVDPVDPGESSEPQNPSLPTSPEVEPTLPPEPSIIYTCMSPGGNTREPMGTPSCPSKWGYVLTPLPA
jgi:hypothetical protein